MEFNTEKGLEGWREGEREGGRVGRRVKDSLSIEVVCIRSVYASAQYSVLVSKSMTRAIDVLEVRVSPSRAIKDCPAYQGDGPPVCPEHVPGVACDIHTM